MRPYAKSDELIPPFSLGYLATAVREKHKIKIVDGIKEKLDQKKFEEILKREDFDIIGIQVFTFQIIDTQNYIKTIKKILPETKIILGGPHPSCSPDNIFDLFPQIDWAFKGEAEIGFAKLVDLIAENKTSSKNLSLIPGLIWHNDQKKTMVNLPIFIENLDEFGIPSWDLMPPNTYPLAPHGGFFKNYPIAPIIITRGCPFSCTYCAGHLISGKKIRHRSITKVIEEIKILYHQYGIREIHIEDDNFTFHHDLVYEFCKKLKENNLDISWTCPNGVRLDSLDKELLLEMKSAGLYNISVGIESGSDKILKDMKKNLTKEKIKEKIRLIKDCGLEVSGFFIIGYPTETQKEILETINFACDLPLNRAGFSLFKPFPGTEITQKLLDQSELPQMSNKDWTHFVLADAIYAPNGLTKKELRSLRRKALLLFYLRPQIIWKFLTSVKNFKHLNVVLKRIYNWLFKAK